MFQTCINFTENMDYMSRVYKYQLDPATQMFLTTLGAGLGGWFGQQGGGSAEQILLQGALRPTLNPQEQAYQNILADVYTGRMYQESDEWKMLQDIWGPTSPEVVKSVTETYELDDPYKKSVAIIGAMDKGKRTEAMNLLNNLRLWEDNAKRGGNMASLYGKDAINNAYAQLEKLGIGKDIASQAVYQFGADPEGFKASVQQYQYLPSSERKQIEQVISAPTETREGPVAEPAEMPEFKPWYEKEEYAGTPLVQALEALQPENILKQIDIQEQMQQRGIGDWYNQTTREASQRGISQYGGYEGSGIARDQAMLAAERARMEQELGWTTGQARAAAERNAPLEALNLLTPLYQWEKSFGQAGQSEALAGLQQMSSLPWGQSQVSTTNYPGPGIIPGAIAGGYGTYQLGKGLGWWGQSATPYGMGLTSPAQQYMSTPLANTGYQNIWNSWMPSI